MVSIFRTYLIYTLDAIICEQFMNYWPRYVRIHSLFLGVAAGGFVAMLDLKRIFRLDFMIQLYETGTANIISPFCGSV